MQLPLGDSYLILELLLSSVWRQDGHGRYGETHQGLLPKWSANRPVHILAYSLGAATARYLQHLMESRAFMDERGNVLDTDGSWYT